MTRSRAYWPISAIRSGDTPDGNILREHGIEPAPEKKRPPLESLSQSSLDVLPAVDFTTIEVRTKDSLFTFSLLFLLELD